ncbi:MAG: hypothetical protein H7144_02040 [Burkholderiales bacterium]|nr:hypothetical protein [Phycisphaerae bacterium]
MASPAPRGADESVARLPHGGYWTRPEVARWTGVVTSVVLHAALIILGLLLIPDVRAKLSDMMPIQEQTIIPTAELATDTPGSIPNPGMNNDASRAVAQNTDASVSQSESWAERKSENLSQTLNSSAAGDASSSPIGMSVKTSGLAASSGNNLAKFGVPGGGQGIGPKGAVFGNGGNAYKIVFICDATGSMLDRWPVLVRELRTTVARLKPVQTFNVVLFRDGTVLALDKSKLIDASTPNKKKLDEFLAKTGPAGATKPAEAIDLAMKLRPDLVYVLVDPQIFTTMSETRDAEGNFAQAIRTARGGQNVRINFVMFHTRNAGKTAPENQSAIKKLTEMAKEFGGSFANVSLEDLYGT